MSEKWVEIILGVVIVVFGFFTKRELNRIDDQFRGLDEKANKEDLAIALKRLDEHIADDKAMRHELAEGLANLNKTLTETQVSVARIAGRLDVQ